MSHYHRCPTTGVVLIDGMPLRKLLGCEIVRTSVIGSFWKGGTLEIKRGIKTHIIAIPKRTYWSWDVVDQIRKIIHGKK